MIVRLFAKYTVADIRNVIIHTELERILKDGKVCTMW